MITFLFFCFSATCFALSVGCKIKADSSSIFGASNKVIKKALHKKKYEYENSVELIRVHDMYEASKVI